MMQGHPAAQQGIALAQADPQVIAALGQPITLGRSPAATSASATACRSRTFNWNL
jgi:hypothetical protein